MKASHLERVKPLLLQEPFFGMLRNAGTFSSRRNEKTFRGKTHFSTAHITRSVFFQVKCLETIIVDFEKTNLVIYGTFNPS